MRFERGQEVKEALKIGLEHTSMKISNIRFILLDGTKFRIHRNRTNLEACIDILENDKITILERLEQGTYQNAGLLEITEDCKVMDDIIEKPIHRWHLGDGLSGKTVKYKGKYYHIPE